MKAPVFVFSALVLTGTFLKAGFEIGNGRKVENKNGGYGITVPDKWEVGLAEKFTEIITPLSEGTPRAKVQINLVKETSFKTLNELQDNYKENENWEPVQIAGFSGVKSETILPTRIRQIEFRLFFKAEELLVVTIEGVQIELPTSSFEKAKKTVESIEVLKKQIPKP